ncbi:MarR family winged helix-turn-helix transcriptional regulator [Arthrobacter sp. Soc17.1.1.1]|uniref:MarR family winged helix-turn-helix transcriptional regulator n=1 Tax=Arthrobacter sp. Soc17.1.1.1 TaxID=3121277 RepID=UPI002FE4BCC8
MEDHGGQVTGEPRRALLDAVEDRAGLMCRSEQRVCRILARRIDPAMEPAAYSVLAAARMLGPCRVTDLAASLGMGNPGVSGHVAALQRLGLVERGPSDGDDRSHPVVLTAEGARRIDEARLSRRRSFRRQLQGWDPADVVELAGLLSRFSAAYLAAREPAAEVPDPRGAHRAGTGLPGPSAGQ